MGHALPVAHRGACDTCRADPTIDTSHSYLAVPDHLCEYHTQPAPRNRQPAADLETRPKRANTTEMADTPADRVRAIRQQHFGPKPRPDIGPQTSADISKLGDELDTLTAKYEMELAAHRDTTAQLLAEKDAVIALLRERIADLTGNHQPQP